MKITRRINSQKFIRIRYGSKKEETWYPVCNLRWLNQRESFEFVKRPDPELTEPGWNQGKANC